MLITVGPDVVFVANFFAKGCLGCVNGQAESSSDSSPAFKQRASSCPNLKTAHQEGDAHSGALGHFSRSSPQHLCCYFVEEESIKDSRPELEHLFVMMQMIRWCLCFLQVL